MEHTLPRTAFRLRRATVETRWRRMATYVIYPTWISLSLPPSHDASGAFHPRSLLPLLSFLLSFIHPSTSPLFSSHPCRDRHPTVIHPSARTLPTSVHGRYRIIPIFLFPSFFSPIRPEKEKKTANNLSGCSSWLVPPLRESLAIRADTFTAFFASEPARLCFFSARKFWLHSENLLIQSYFIHPTLVPSLKTISVRSFMRMLKERVAVNMGMLFIFVTARTLTWRIGISSRSLP